MNKKLIKDLQLVAWQIGWFIGKHRMGTGWDNMIGDGGAFWWSIPKEGTLRFVSNTNDKSWVEFRNIRPSKISKAKYHPPVLTNTVIGDLNSSVIKNGSENISIERSYTFSEDETTSVSEDAGVEVGISLRQQIGYGGAVAPVTGETEISASINAHYNKMWGTETSKGREIQNTIEVPPRTEATISVQKSTSDFEQKTEYWCELDYEIVIWTTAEFEVIANSRAHLAQLVKGLGEDGHHLTRKYRDNPESEWVIKKMVAPVNAHIEQTVKFSNASTGDVTVTERKI